MSSTFPVRVSQRAQRQINAAQRWWLVHRQAAPDAIRQELSAALALLAAQPEAGARYAGTDLPGVRRLFLRRIRYYIYYQLGASPSCVLVLALWHESRGTDPAGL